MSAAHLGNNLFPCAHSSKPIAIHCPWLWQAVLRQFPNFHGKHLILQVIQGQVKYIVIKAEVCISQ